MKPTSSRRILRIKVLQVLYAHEIAKEPVEKIKRDLLPDITDPENYKFVSDLIDTVLKNANYVDELIENKITNWEFDRVALIDKIVLRMGLTEILYFPEIPPKVSINEAIEISKEYCTNQSGKFVNGILDSLLQEFIKENKIHKQGRGLLDIKKRQQDEK